MAEKAFVGVVACARTRSNILLEKRATGKVEKVKGLSPEGKPVEYDRPVFEIVGSLYDDQECVLATHRIVGEDKAAEFFSGLVDAGNR